MGQKTKIDWADSSWNPVTGCSHGCEYCYARGIAERFGGFIPDECPDGWRFCRDGDIMELDSMQMRQRKDGKVVKAVYPIGFKPTLHRYRLEDPQRWKKPRTIFVCSMADLFGAWVPDEWIRAVFDACKAAPQHRYMFLTKNPQRYYDLAQAGELPMEEKFWYGTSVTKSNTRYFQSIKHNCFLSVEPILQDFGHGYFGAFVDWVIVGAETGNRKDKVIPEKKWIDNIAWWWCSVDWRMSDGKIPIFMKESLRNLMGGDFRQELPWKED